MPLDRSKVLHEIKSRQKVLNVAIIVVFGLLLCVSFFLQVVRGDFYYELSERNRIRVYQIKPSRGKIYDRDGNPIAYNQFSYDLYMIPYYVKKAIKNFKGKFEEHRIFKLLVKYIHVDPNRLSKQFKEGRFAPLNPRLVKKDLTLEELARFEEMKWLFKGFYVEAGEVRYYPYGDILAHVIGYVGEATSKEVSSGFYYAGDVVGRTGIEKIYDSELRGIGGWEQWEVDALGNRKRLVTRSLPVKGKDIYLTIVLPLQKKAKELMEGKEGAVVALDPKTGEVLCLYSAPSFDPNVFPKGVSPKKWRSLIRDKRRPLHNRVIQGMYPPGSVFKLVVALAGLMEGKIKPSDVKYCSGAYFLGNRMFRCWKSQGHGNVNLYKAIVESCDVYFYELGYDLGAETIANYARMLNLGKKTGIDLPHEKRGIVPDPEWKKRVYKQVWFPGETIIYSIGQGYISTTPLQLALVTSFFANGGYIVKPHLRKDLSYKPVKLNIPKRFINVIKKAMLGVVEDKDGTAHHTAFIDGVKVAGKTGTVQVVSSEIEERYKEGKEIKVKRYKEHGWFVAFAPYDDPVIAVSVIVEHGGSGSSSAAPIAKEIIKEYLKYRGMIKVGEEEAS